MKKIITTLLLLLPTVSFGYGGSWIDMQSTGSQRIDSTFSQCSYKQTMMGKYSVSITIQGNSFSCPYRIKYNPVSGKWKR